MSDDQLLTFSVDKEALLNRVTYSKRLLILRIRLRYHIMEDNCNSTTAMNSYLAETIQFLEVVYGFTDCHLTLLLNLVCESIYYLFNCLSSHNI